MFYVEVNILNKSLFYFIFFFQAEDGIRDDLVTGVQTCALPILVTPPGLSNFLYLKHNCNVPTVSVVTIAVRTAKTDRKSVV